MVDDFLFVLKRAVSPKFWQTNGILTGALTLACMCVANLCMLPAYLLYPFIKNQKN